MTEIDETTAPEDITAAVAASFDSCSDPRLVEVVTALVRDRRHTSLRLRERLPWLRRRVRCQALAGPALRASLGR
jgi:hypothetical protein